ncbi:MAG: hypothetical protein ABW094_03200 [Candidatus Thiodiazotropha sp.]
MSQLGRELPIPFYLGMTAFNMLCYPSRLQLGLTMINVGCVLYTKGEEPGSLNAKWCHPLFGKGVFGTGKATGGPVEGFVGRYQIQYFDAEGNHIAGFELDIKKDSEYYELAWIDNGTVLDRGIGMEVSEGLAAGWRRIKDTPPQDFETQE